MWVVIANLGLGQVLRVSLGELDVCSNLDTL